MSDGLSEDALYARRLAWGQIREIVTSDATDRKKLEKCLDVGRVHCAITGDDSLIPQPVRDLDAGLVKSIGDIMKMAASVKKEKTTGQRSLL